MSRRSRLVGAALGLLLLAGPIGNGPVRAQTGGDFTAPSECSDPPPAKVENGILATVVSPTGTDPRTSPNVPVEATFSNESRRPVVNQYNGQIAELRAFVYACEAGLVVPAAPDPVQPAGDPRTASVAWSAEFPTNGRYVIVLEADGTSSNPDAKQSARVVVPVTLAVPPKKPTNVDVSEPSNGVVSVSWDYVEPEPDLFGFEIRRARQGSSAYTTIQNGAVGPKARTVSDSPPAGAWRYQVIAYRKGAPEGAVSRDATVEVAEPAPAAAGTGTGGGAGSTGSTAPGGTSSGSTPGATNSTVGGTGTDASGTPRSTLDLSNFAATLNARRAAPATRIEPPDPGFDETLPFDTSRPLEVDEEEPEELGADEPNVGLGQQPISDPGERQRSLGFVAFGLLLFVLSMTGLFVKSEVKRADLLALDAVGDGDVDETPEVNDVDALAAAPVVATAAATRAPRRRRRSAPEPEAATVESEPEPEPVTVEPQPDPEPVQPAAVTAGHRRPRTRRAPSAPTFEIPESRNRWSGRVSEPTNGHAPDAAVHDFDDLAPVPAAAAAGAAAPARRHRTSAVPLDAPDLDVPDPVAIRRRASRPAKPALPARKKPTATRR